jgi:hypothetical protein
VAHTPYTPSALLGGYLCVSLRPHVFFEIKVLTMLMCLQEDDSEDDYSSVPEDSSDYSSEELSDSGLDSDEAEVCLCACMYVCIVSSTTNLNSYWIQAWIWMKLRSLLYVYMSLLYVYIRTGRPS